MHKGYEHGSCRVSSSNLIRAGGLATMLAGVLLIVTGIAFMGPLGLADTAEEFTTGGNALMVWLSVVGLVLLQIGLVAMYAEQSRALGVTGLVGFVAAFFSTALTLGYGVALALVMPAVARVAPDRLLGTLVCCGLLTWVLTCVVFSMGLFLLGLAARRAWIYPVWAARVIMIGAVINAVPLPGTSLVLAAGLVWVGFVLFSRRDPLNRPRTLAYDDNVGENPSPGAG